MRFTATFDGQPHAKNRIAGHSAMCTEWRDIGFDDIDWIRESLGIAHLSLSKIHYVSYGIHETPTYEISEEVARDSGHFTDKGKLTVTVPAQSLNRFAHKTIVVSIDETTGEVNNVKIVPKLDEKEVVDAWATSGYPLEWYPEGETK